jgi:Ran GTPase-activating protein (RanGAP) involved in mRNA processing and transport
MTMMKIDMMLGKWMSGLFWMGLVLTFLLWPTLPGYSQELDSQGPVDYDKLFNEGLKRGGKLLNLSGKKIGDAGVDLLIASGILGKVEKVDLRYNDISAAGAKRIAEMSPLPKIKVLIMRHNILGDTGSLALAQSKSFPNLQEMQLGWTETRDAGALAFGKTTNFPKLKKLDLRGNFLANTTKDSLKKSLEHLRSLKLY